MTGEEWLSLPMEKVVEILSSDELEVEREEYVFDAATTWLHHSYSTRSGIFHKVTVFLVLEEGKEVNIHGKLKQTCLIVMLHN